MSSGTADVYCVWTFVYYQSLSCFARCLSVVIHPRQTCAEDYC